MYCQLMTMIDEALLKAALSFCIFSLTHANARGYTKRSNHSRLDISYLYFLIKAVIILWRSTGIRHVTQDTCSLKAPEYITVRMTLNNFGVNIQFLFWTVTTFYLCNDKVCITINSSISMHHL